MSEPACTRCGASYVPREKGTHRRYCAVPCRRDVEYEVRRLRRRLGRQSREVTRRVEIDRWSGGLYSTLRYLDGTSWLAETNGIRGEIRAAKKRLVLLGSRPTTKTTRTRRAVPAPATEHPTTWDARR